MSDIKVLDYKLEPLSVQEFGADFVITFYAQMYAAPVGPRGMRVRAFRA